MSYTEYYVGFTVNGYYLSTRPFHTLSEAEEAFGYLSTAHPNVTYEVYEATFDSVVYNPKVQSDPGTYGPYASAENEDVDDDYSPDVSMDDYSSSDDEDTIEEEENDGEKDAGHTNFMASDDHTLFQEMIVFEYGKGLILFPPEGHSHSGTKYYEGGWWMPKMNGWFFKKSYLDTLIDFGAFFVTTQNTQDPSSSSPNTPADEEVVDANTSHFEMIGPFTGMIIEPYGKGYLLAPPPKHSDAGIKYYHSGWWKANMNAWFFKKNRLDYLIHNGATMSSE